MGVFFGCSCSRCSGSVWSSIAVTKIIFTQTSTSYGFDCGPKMIPEKTCIRGTSNSVHLGMLCPKIAPRSSQKRVNITFPAGGSLRNFFDFGDKRWRHSPLVPVISGSWLWTQISLPVTILDRKLSPSDFIYVVSFRVTIIWTESRSSVAASTLACRPGSHVLDSLLRWEFIYLT